MAETALEGRPVDAPEVAAAVLVAGVGNIFRRDDGWGSEVARRLACEPLPAGVQVTDYGIGGIHLAYDLLEAVDLFVLVDALPRDVAPGTVTVLEVDPDGLPATGLDSHAMDPVAVLANVRALGGALPRTLIVGCEPADTGDGMGLSAAAQDAIAPAIELITTLLADAGARSRRQDPADA